MLCGISARVLIWGLSNRSSWHLVNHLHHPKARPKDFAEKEAQNGFLVFPLCHSFFLFYYMIEILEKDFKELYWTMLIQRSVCNKKSPTLPLPSPEGLCFCGFTQFPHFHPPIKLDISQNIKGLFQFNIFSFLYVLSHRVGCGNTIKINNNLNKIEVYFSLT